MNSGSTGLSLLAPGGAAFELLVTSAAWGAAAVGLWWITSVGLWVAANRRPALTPLLKVTIPGSRRAAGALLGLALMTGACASGPSTPGIEVLGPVPEVFDPATDERGPTTTALVTSEPATTTTTTEAPTTQAPTTEAPTTQVPTTEPEAPTDPTEDGSQASTPTQDEGDELAGSQHTVQRGESLWSIAAGVVRDNNPEATSADVAEYWTRLITTTRDQLTSSSPDLIFPGEAITLPPR